MGMTLKLYDMTGGSDNETALDAAALVTTVEINGVDFTTPSGSFRLNGSYIFSHFAAQIEGATLIFKVTNIKWINALVVEYSYTLDVLKNWWLYVGGSNMGIFQYKITRIWSAAPADGTYSKALQKLWLNDPEDKPTGAISYNLSLGNNISSNLWCLVINTFSNDMTAGDYDPQRITTTYFLDYTGVHLLIYNLNTSQYAAAFYKQIAGFYKVPGAYVDGSGNFNVEGVATTVKPINYVGLDENGQVVTANMTTGWFVGTSSDRVWAPHVIYNTGIGISLESYRDIYHTKYNLNIPYVGNVEIPTTLLVKAARNQTDSIAVTLYVGYFYDFVDGTFNVAFDNGSMVTTNPTLVPLMFHATLPMPTTALPTGAQALSFYSNEVSLKGGMVSGAANVATNLATGSVIGAGISALNMGVSAFQNSLHNEIITASGQSYGNLTGWSGSYAHYFSMVTIREIFKNSLVAYRGRAGYLYDDYVTENMANIFTELTETYRTTYVTVDPESNPFSTKNVTITYGSGAELKSILSNAIALMPVYDPFA